LLQSTKGNCGLPPRFGWRHAGLDVGVDLPFQVKLQFLVYFSMAPVSEKEAQACQKLFEHVIS
jgi:hypothetical protein